MTTAKQINSILFRHAFVPEVRNWQVGKLYLYACVCPPYVKLGITTDPLRRAAGIMTTNPFPFTFFLLNEIRDHWDEEAKHERFKSLRHRGEWFKLEGELESLLELALSSARLLGMLVCEPK